MVDTCNDDFDSQCCNISDQVMTQGKVITQLPTFEMLLSLQRNHKEFNTRSLL